MAFKRLYRLANRLTRQTHSSRGRAPGAFATSETPWDWDLFLRRTHDPAVCNLCGWSGASFLDGQHSEKATCQRCGSIARDRFLFFCFVTRSPPKRYRILETSPRLGKPYRLAMQRWFNYRASDFDQRCHRADLVIDLQNIDIQTASVDILLTPHVLEHVPDTDRALAEIFRILAPGGRMYLQVPLLQAKTAPPIQPEFHADQTPVAWRFGPDLTARLRDQGFETRLLCTERLYNLVATSAVHWPEPTSAEFDVESLLLALELQDLDPIANVGVSRRLGFEPAYMFLTWEATKLVDQ